MWHKLLSKTAFVFLLLNASHVLCFANVDPDSISFSTVKSKQVTPSIQDSFPKKVTEIIIIGNKLTKSSIILRELTFHASDTLNPADFDKTFRQSEDNLMNLSLFNSVHINCLINDPQTMTVYIILKERWYIFPFPIFEIVDRNFNEWWRSKDYSKINYGGVITWNNFRGRNETIGVTLRLGYTQRVSLFYTLPFISKGQKSGLSFSFAYSRNHETAYRTFYNDLVYFKDENNFSRKDLSGSVLYTFRKGLYQTHMAEAGFKHAEVEDTIVRLNRDFFSRGNALEKYFSLRYIYKVEHRDLVAYPLQGSYFDFELVKVGLPPLRDNINFSYAASAYKRYWQLGKRIYFSSSAIGKISDNNPQPFYNTGGLGFGSIYLRGYEYYVIEGQNYGLVKTNFKFELLSPHSVHARFIPLEKFATIPYAIYINVYGDAGYVRDRQFSAFNSLTNNLQYSFGSGIDLVTYYDLVFRLEYSVNKFGESGIFLHFSAPI